MAQNSKRKIAGTPVLLEAKARQASKLAEIREALVAAGYDTTAKQAAVLGVSRATAWVVLNRDMRAGPSSIVIKRILSSPNLPWAARRIVKEYIDEKIAGLYGHSEGRVRWFGDQFASRSGGRHGVQRKLWLGVLAIGVAITAMPSVARTDLVLIGETPAASSVDLGAVTLLVRRRSMLCMVMQSPAPTNPPRQHVRFTRRADIGG